MLKEGSEDEMDSVRSRSHSSSSSNEDSEIELQHPAAATCATVHENQASRCELLHCGHSCVGPITLSRATQPEVIRAI